MPNDDAKTDYYEVLDVDSSATEAEIKRAYRRLARKYHPDVNRDDPSAEDTFKRISEAYAVLSDPERRARYDRYGDGVPADFGAAGGAVDIFDIFASAFGGDPFGFGAGAGRQVRAGRDLRYDLEIGLEEVLNGSEPEIEYSRLAACETCDGTGAAPGTSPTPCATCGGVGRVQAARNTFFGTISTVQECPQCGGAGEVIPHPCEECDGRAVVSRREKLTISIPAGVRTGNELVLRGFGEAPMGGGRTGDLYVRLHVRDHERFVREGDDIVGELTLSVAQAALGDTVTVEGLDGPVEIRIHAGTQTADDFAVPSRGLPKLNSDRRGSLRMRAKVETPRDLTPRQRELLIAFAAERGEEVNPEDKSLFERIRDAIAGH